MIRCPRCRGDMTDQDGIYCDACWEELEEDQSDRYTASADYAAQEAEDDLSDMQEPYR